MEPNNLHDMTPKPSLDRTLQNYGKHASFAPRFAARVQERILAQQRTLPQSRILTPFEVMLQEIWDIFPRFLLAGVAAAAILAFYNVSLSPEGSVEWFLGDAFGLSAEVQEME